jgi:hypothetical protein
MLVYSDEEWRKRSFTTLWRYSLKEYVKIYAWMLLVPLFFLLFYLFYPGASGDDALLWLVVMLAIGLILALLFLVYVKILALKRGRLMGLYERGIQVTPFHFTPYTGITRVERTTYGSAQWEMVAVHNNSTRAPENPLMVPFMLLGEEGMEELERRVHSAGSPE